MTIKEKKIGILTLFVNVVYILWLSLNLNYTYPASWFLLFADTSFVTLLIFYLINNWKQIHLTNSSKPAVGTLDIFLPIVNEPIDMFEDTLKCAIQINYNTKLIYILDDSNREELRLLSNKYGVNYVASQYNTNFKAGNLNNGLEISHGDYILVLDADQKVINFELANELLGYFTEDEQLSIISTKQNFSLPADDFNHERLFYNRVQPGKNNGNGAFSCGSGVFYRRTALDKIGGFQTWNLVEDLTTSYKLHIEGFKSLYINKSYTIGLAPLDVTSIYKQRGVWALDTLRLLFRKNPLLQSSLTIRQKLYYFETCWVYLVTAISIPILLLIIPITLFLEIDIIKPSIMYPLLRIPSFLLYFIFYEYQAPKTLINAQMWTSLFPVYIKALFLSVLPYRPQYKVTRKIFNESIEFKDIILVLPQIGAICLNFSAIIWHIYYLHIGYNTKAILCIFWLIMFIIFFSPIIRKSIKCF